MPDLAHIVPNFQLQPIDLVSPGFRGLNFVQSGSLLSPAYATEALNAILDSAGRLAARDGVTSLTTTPVTNKEIRNLFVYRKGDGSTQTLITWDGGISNNVANPVAGDISGAVDDDPGNWWFQNFNDKVLGFQASSQPIVYNGAGNFANLSESAGTAPDGGIALAAYGRVWIADPDGQTIKYSALLDETTWSGADTGTIDMRKVWTNGTDTITAIWAFNGALLVFGKRHIVFWTDGQGSAIGIDPLQMYVSDIVTGAGTLSQWSIQPVGETDLIFLSSNGVQSIKRLIQERSSPISTLSKYVRDELLIQLQAEDGTRIRSTYNALNGFYLLSFPTTGQTWVLDQRRRYIDEDNDELSVITRWNIAPSALVTRDDNSIYMSISDGVVGRYLGDNDLGTGILFRYQSPWLDLGEDLANRLKILKRLGAILFVRNETTITFKWNVDFDDGFQLIQRTVRGDAAAEFGIGEFGDSEWSGGLALRIIKVPARKGGRGQYYRIGIEATVNGEFAIQQAELFTKIGRLA